MTATKKISGMIVCRVCKGSGLKGSESCPRCSTEEDRRFGMPGSGLDPDATRGCVCEVEHD